MSEKLREQAEEFAAWVAGFDWEALRFATDLVRGFLDKAQKVWASDAPAMPRLTAIGAPRIWAHFATAEPLTIGEGD